MKLNFLGKRKSNCLFSFIIMLVASLAISCSGNDEFDAQPEDPQTRATFDSDAFVTEWLVPEGGVVTLPIDTNYYYNCIIDWGDGSNLTRIFSRKDYNQAWHRYRAAGTFRIQILGDYSSWNLIHDSPCKKYLTKVAQWGNVNFQTLNTGFFDCPNLVSIPARIPALESYSGTFLRCTGLVTLPDDLFANSGTSKDFSSTFESCTNLRTLPPNLFKNCFNARNFSATFYNCGMVTLPTGLFENCLQATDLSFTFGYCTNLVTLPTDLFTSCPEATDFTYTFWWCTSLTSMPPTLFANCKKVTSFNGTFLECSALTGKTPVSDEGFELWQRAKKIGYPDAIDGRDCFSGCTGLDGHIDPTWR